MSNPSKKSPGVAAAITMETPPYVQVQVRGFANFKEAVIHLFRADAEGHLETYFFGTDEESAAVAALYEYVVGAAYEVTSPPTSMYVEVARLEAGPPDEPSEVKILRNASLAVAKDKILAFKDIQSKVAARKDALQETVPRVERKASQVQPNASPISRR